MPSGAGELGKGYAQIFASASCKGGFGERIKGLMRPFEGYDSTKEDWECSRLVDKTVRDRAAAPLREGFGERKFKGNFLRGTCEGRYKLIKEVGDGTFGSVWRAINKHSGEVVAVKKMKRKYYTWEECMNLREVKSLRRMNHPNIVKLTEVIRENDLLYFIFEYMECNLYQLIRDRDRLFTETEIRNWCYQIFHGLAYMHHRGYFHRDLKPENLLLTKEIIKIADFGLARELNSQQPFTEYVSTRWYRAPEVLLQCSSYDASVDMWAMGAIMAELFTLRPLFPGSNEADEIHKICCVIGSPDHESWAQGLQLASDLSCKFPEVAGANWRELFPSASENAVDLIKSLCAWDPNKRPKAAEVLLHPFFQDCYYVPPSLCVRAPNTPSSVGSKASLELRSARRYSTGALSNAKLSANVVPTKKNSSLMSGVQRKLTMDHKVMYEKSMKNTLKKLGNHPPARVVNMANMSKNIRMAADETNKKSHTTALRRSSSKASNELEEKLAKLSISSGFGKAGSKASASAARPPPSLKTGLWHNNTDLLTRSYELPSVRRYSRKVAG
ncbi:hypothetical protein HPP92_001301 [Vanilla planifolia]|uniref:cyclin-dependent kinase n=1 Tax=Vanilla planifolia TaxID=51239 RepID=A0A835RWA7_VANPL|nr:hypothetical protein HPP92_001460 [Vanilla planifolia]KAG0501229.1 hypothetical protein HPP92_001301 [Vanilla planifolia]